MRSVIHDRSLLEADWPATKPGQEVGPDDTDLARFAMQFSHEAPPADVLVAIQAVDAFRPDYSGCRDERSGSSQAHLQARCVLVWPRLRRRWRLIETGLAEVAAGAFGREALRYNIAVQDAWQRFDGEPEEREALFNFYSHLVDTISWPEGFSRVNLLMSFMLD